MPFPKVGLGFQDISKVHDVGLSEHIFVCLHQRWFVGVKWSHEVQIHVGFIQAVRLNFRSLSWNNTISHVKMRLEIFTFALL